MRTSPKSSPEQTPEDEDEFDPARALAAEGDRIRGTIAEIDLALAQTNDPDADADHDFSEEGGEGAGAAVDRDRDTAMRAQLVERLDAVAAAEQRLADGTYGICVTCGKPIAPARLEVLPATTECVTCASAPLLTRRSR
jgi:RNA polymerase-binding transcription factor DksA